MLTFGASFLCVNSPATHTRTLIIFFMNCPQIGQSLGTESMFPHALVHADRGCPFAKLSSACLRNFHEQI